MKKNLFLLALLLPLALPLALLSSSSAAARSYDEVIAAGVITIAVYSDFPPYSYLQDGIAKGIDIELGQQIAQDLGVSVEWFWLTADENLEDDLRNAVWKGHYLHRKVADLMLRVPYDRDFAFMIDSYGEMKNEQVVMLAPYHTERWTVARNRQALPQLSNLAPFQYHRIGVETDTVPDLTLTSSFGGRLRDNVVHFLSPFAALDEFQQQKIDAVAGMRAQLEWGVQQLAPSSPALDIAIDDSSLVQWSRRAWDIGIAIKSSYRQLGYAVEASIEQRVKNGSMQQLFARYHLSYELPSLYIDSPQPR